MGLNGNDVWEAICIELKTKKLITLILLKAKRHLEKQGDIWDEVFSRSSTYL